MQRCGRPFHRVADRFEEAVALAVLVWFRPRLVYANTVKAACYVRPAIWLGIPVVLHVHELEPLASTTLARYHLADSYERVALVGCSAAVCENLERVTGVPVQRMVLVPSMVDVEAIASRVVPAHPREDADDLLTIGACAAPIAGRVPISGSTWSQCSSPMTRSRSCASSGSARATPGSPIVRQSSTSCSTWSSSARSRTWCRRSATSTSSPFPPVRTPFPSWCSRRWPRGDRWLPSGSAGSPTNSGKQASSSSREIPSPWRPRSRSSVRDPRARSQLGDRARSRVREHYSIERFHTLVVHLVEQVLDTVDASSTVIEFEPAPHRRGEVVSAFMLKYFDAAKFMQGRALDRHLLPYGADAIVAADVRLRMSDASMRPPWTSRLVRTTLGVVERSTTPFLQAWANRKEIAASDAVIAMFESHANGIAVFPPTGMVAVPPATVGRHLLLARRGHQAVPDEQTSAVSRLVPPGRPRAVLQLEPGVAPGLRAVAAALTGRAIPFGVEPPAELALDARPAGDGAGAGDGDGDGHGDDGYVLAVGRDRGRDWRTLFEAAALSDHRFVVACRPEEIAHLDVPGNVQCVGFVPRERYLELTRNARLVVVATRALAYPTGQSVALEAMAMGKCCIVTDTEPMRDYLRHEDNALLVPVGDTGALDAMIDRAWSDADLRRRIGERACESVGRDFTEAIMWARIGAAVREVVGASPSDAPDVAQCADV